MAIFKLNPQNDCNMPTWKSAEMKILILGDQSTETFKALCSPQALKSSTVQDFLTQCNLALRRELSLLPRFDKAQFPDLPLHVDALQDWVQWGRTHPVLRPVLTAASQCVQILQYADTEDIDLSKHCILGSCTGLLVAAAATVGPYRSSKWIQLAVHIVCVAFRIGVHTTGVGERLTSTNESWSRTIQGKLDPELLSKFHEIEGIPLPHFAYVSATTPNSTTISGPPQTLKRFFASAVFQATGQKSISIPVFAPYHAAHLHREAEINWIIGIDDLVIYRSFQILDSSLP
ncbi:uncharacterized protein ATNIH1004_005724 [Aspergillus tanneri]|uniref:Starter acyltransferase (SAT) domain-containing protein n=1 Tax=Aspergillus tanneri TaxID=1220188 RepID=A0A5M9MJ55_9EURO|nr:uncharacterized protein ATNIH1004_005724 [Aspergillus tanneri]KAA8647041.1 hypothetical protein ATNIH1004_005724 [Aspergillus tanneri]